MNQSMFVFTIFLFALLIGFFIQYLKRISEKRKEAETAKTFSQMKEEVDEDNTEEASTTEKLKQQLTGNWKITTGLVIAVVLFVLCVIFGFKTVFHVLAPFILVPIVGFLAYYTGKDKRYKSIGYAVTVSVVTGLVILIMVHPEVLKMVIQPFLESEPMQHVTQSINSIDTVFVSVVVFLVAGWFFLNGHIATSLILAFVLFVYLSNVYVI